MCEAPWCAWQESNLLPLAPQASALSGELQAQEGFQFRRASIAAVAALNVVRSRLPATTSATKTERCQQANRTEGRSYVNELMPSPVLVPREHRQIHVHRAGPDAHVECRRHVGRLEDRSSRPRVRRWTGSRAEGGVRIALACQNREQDEHR